MKYLVDTCVVSELTKKRPSARVVQWLKRQDEFSLFFSVITFGELHKGICRLPDSRKQRHLQDWVENDLAQRFTGRILNIDREVALKWGEISAEAEKIGRKIPVVDGLLAATALVSGLTLVTRNTQDVEAAGVPFLDPWQA